MPSATVGLGADADRIAGAGVRLVHSQFGREVQVVEDARVQCSQDSRQHPSTAGYVRRLMGGAVRRPPLGAGPHRARSRPRRAFVVDSEYMFEPGFDHRA